MPKRRAHHGTMISDPGVSRRERPALVPLSRSVRVRSKTRHTPISHRPGRETVRLESATHPRATSNQLALAFRHAGVCESRIAASRKPGTQDRNPAPRYGEFVCDQPPNCQRARDRRCRLSLLVALLARGRSRRMIRRHRPATRCASHSVDCTAGKRWQALAGPARPFRPLRDNLDQGS